MANPTNIPPVIIKLLNQARFIIPSEYRQQPKGGIVADPDTVFVHINNNWAFLNGYAFVKLSGFAKG
jgi:hypothetical protein